MQENQQEDSSGYVHVPSRLLPTWDEYCPIAHAYGHFQPDGSFLADTYSKGIHDQVSISQADILDEPGFLVLHLGSIEEDYTVETAVSAIHHSVKSLFAGCGTPVDLERVRTTIELSEFLKHYRSKYSHLIAVGHGTREGLPFLDRRQPVQGHELAGFLGRDTTSKSLQIISLCCHSGCESLAKSLSQSHSVSEVIAPHREFDMRWAVHFVTGFFLEQYLTGRSVDDAVATAARNSGNAPMCVWRKGILAGECASGADPQPSIACDSETVD